MAYAAEASPRCPHFTWLNCSMPPSAMCRSRVSANRSKIRIFGGTMANATASAPTVTIAATQGAADAEILTPQALEFLGALAAKFEATRQELLAARITRGEELRQGKLYNFLPATASVRAGDWRVAPIP